MVRLTDSSVEECFERKRIDIRYAITQKGFCRDRSAYCLPEIPAASALPNPLFVRKNGASVLAIDFSDGKVIGKGVKDTAVDRRHAPPPPELSSVHIVRETEGEEFDDSLMYAVAVASHMIGGVGGRRRRSKNDGVRA
jgi:hypothetical protein